RHTRSYGDWSSDVCSSDLGGQNGATLETWLLRWQDTLQSWVYDAGAERPQAPFASPTPLQTLGVSQTPPALAATPTPIQTLGVQIGRASCRERAEEQGGGM